MKQQILYYGSGNRDLPLEYPTYSCLKHPIEPFIPSFDIRFWYQIDKGKLIKTYSAKDPKLILLICRKATSIILINHVKLQEKWL